MRRRCDRRSIVPRTAPGSRRAWVPRMAPGSRRAWVPGLVLLLGVAAACGGSSRVPERLYRWTDAEGSVHYTAKRSSIPRVYRLSARSVAPDGSDGPADAGAGALATDPVQSVSSTGAEPAPPDASHPGRGAETKSVEAAPPSTPELDARIREVETAIARDEETLKLLIAEDPAEGRDSLAASRQLREIAQRLPGLQAELRSLRAQRAAQAAP